MKALVIDKSELLSNLEAIKARCPNMGIYGVLKSDAYGLGLLNVARCMREAGIGKFAVSEPEDALRLRREGFTHEEILMLRPTGDPAEIELLLDAGAVATISSQETALVLSGIAERRSTVAEAHIKIDTGFGRYGFLYSETDKILNIGQYMQGIAITGVYTHLNSQSTRKHIDIQLAHFDNVLQTLRENGIETGTVHACGSTSLFRYNDLPLYDAVRVGTAISGRLPVKTNLFRIGEIRANLTEVRWLPAHSAVSGKGKLRHATKIAVLPVGYADGCCINRQHLSIRQRLSLFLAGEHKKTNSIHLSGGEKLKVLGRIGHSHMVLDITKTEAGLGTEVFIDVDPLFSGQLKKVYV